MSKPYEAPPVNPYVAGPPLKYEASPVRYRDISLVILLMVVTVGFYWFYLCYQWAKELNALEGREKYPPVLVLAVNIITCGMAGLVYECLFAFDLVHAAQRFGIARRNPQLGNWVMGLNIGAIGGSLIPFGFLVGVVLGTVASCLLQHELNQFASQMEYQA